MKQLFTYYKPLNFTMLGLSIYAMIYPIISYVLSNISPTLTACPYKSTTGLPCPLCGGTTFFSDILQNGFHLNDFTSVFGIIFVLVIIELISRIILIWNAKKLTLTIFKIDFIYHILLGISYLAYFITFMIIQQGGV